MARLIVEEDGKRRRFRLNPGKLTIGSGEDATLRLTSEGVARLHAVLEYDGEVFTLHLEPGVAPVKVGVKTRSGSIELKLGQTVLLGKAQLRIEEETGSAPPKGGGSRVRAGASSARGRASRDESAVGSRPRRSPERRKSASIPSWLIIVIGLGGALWVFKLLGDFSETSSVQGFSAKASQVRIDDKLANKDFKGILAEVEWVNEHRAELTAEWRKYFDEVQKQAEEMRDEGQLYARNSVGTKLFTTQLEKFQSTYLKRNTRPEARVFLKRIAAFRADFPRHSKLDWCSRMERRYEDIAKLNEPPTMEDLAFEVKTLTWSMPRDYKQAFAALEAFLALANESDEAAAMALIQEKEAEREAYFDDRTLQAAYYFERKQKNKAIGELAQLVAKIGDPVMADDAARRLLKFEDLDSTLRGYRNDRVSMFEALMNNKLLRDYAETHNVF